MPEHNWNTTMISDKQNGALQLVDAAQVRDLTEKAAAAPRKRSHLLLHSGPDDLVQRLIVAAQPGTYFRPHQHSRQWEMLILQQGSFDVLTFDRNGNVQNRTALNKMASIWQTAASQWHTFIVHDPDTVIVEVKPGPYHPNEFADWAPEEGHEQAEEFLLWAVSAKLGEQWQHR
jgi:cupin fold WbuC family metalloprotein